MDIYHCLTDKENEQAFNIAKLRTNDAIKRDAKITYDTGALTQFQMNFLGCKGEEGVETELHHFRRVIKAYESDPSQFLGTADFLFDGKLYEVKTRRVKSQREFSSFLINKATYEEKTKNSDYVICVELICPNIINLYGARKLYILGMIQTRKIPSFPYIEKRNAYYVPLENFKEIPMG